MKKSKIWFSILPGLGLILLAIVFVNTDLLFSKNRVRASSRLGDESNITVYKTDFYKKNPSYQQDIVVKLTRLLRARDQKKQSLPTGSLTIDYPMAGSIFPPDMIAPTFLFHEKNKAATSWLVKVLLPAGEKSVYVLADGRKEKPRLDPETQSVTNTYKESLYQATAKAWTPDPDTWKLIRASKKDNVTIVFFGTNYDVKSNTHAGQLKLLSKQSVNIRISEDRVGAPIFYRDVPLMPRRNLSGVISPLDKKLIPLIQWRLRDLAKSESWVVLKSMPTCGNCHSFSANGRWLGMDMDGPAGDKGAYALAPTKKKMVIKNENVFSWNKYNKEKVTYGLFSRVSPDGRYVVSAVDESVYVANYLDFRFLQTFFPTKGILAVYDREKRAIKPLPGADDANYIQGNPVWSPDGKTIVFIRAKAITSFPPGRPPAKEANDPNETQIKYDLYSIPFNNGRGGQAVSLKGASNNGMSNSFAKFSPDGKWIVYVQAKNGLLMRPDSKLFIIPAKGGNPRRLSCNLPTMNSWHSWSPNSRWLVFSSKANKPFTEMFLTHIDAQGNATPAILVPNSTAYNRAVNIPEFVNIPGNGIEEIQVPAVNYRLFLDKGKEYLAQKNYNDALKELQKSLEEKPDYPITLIDIGLIYREQGELDKAIKYFKQALAIDKTNVQSYLKLGNAYLMKKDPRQAIENFRIALKINPMNHDIHYSIGNALNMLKKPQDAIRFFKNALRIDPDNAHVHYVLGNSYNMLKQNEEAVASYEKSLSIDSNILNARYNLGVTLSKLGRFNIAVGHFRQYVEKKTRDAVARQMYAIALNRIGDTPGAIKQYEATLALNPKDLLSVNNLAWILSTAPEAKLRDGARALEMAKKLCRITNFSVDNALDTLAVAYAENGLFKEAVKYAKMVLEKTNPSDPKYKVRTRLLDLYTNGKAFPLGRE